MIIDNFTTKLWTFSLHYGKSKIADTKIRTSKTNDLFKEEIMKKAQYSLLYLMATILGLVLPISCSSDETKGGGSAGTTATGGSGGISEDSGTGGDGNISESGGNEGGAGEAGTSKNGWKKGVVGKAKELIALAKKAGNLQGIATDSLAIKTFDLPPDAKESTEDDEHPQTAPIINGAELGDGKFNRMILPILAYQQNDGTPIPPYTMIVDGDWKTEMIQHFETWPSKDVDMSCYTPYPTQINGQSMKAYGGFSMDTTVCLNRWFLVTNGSTKVWELYPDGTRTALTDLQKPLSAILCHPQGYLIVSALTTYVLNEKFEVKTPSAIYKIDLDGTTQLIADMPVPDDYATNDMFGLCGAFPGISPDYIPPGMNIFLTLHPDGRIIVGEMGTQRIYNIEADGSVTEFAKMEELTIGGLLAPNEVIYTIIPPMTNQIHSKVYKGTMIRAFTNGKWSDVTEITGYDTFLHAMQNFSRGTPCVEDPSGFCFQPVGIYFKLAAGTEPVLLITDPIKGELSAIPLDMDEVDSGAGGSSGSSGAGGKGGDSESTDAGDSAESSE